MVRCWVSPRNRAQLHERSICCDALMSGPADWKRPDSARLIASLPLACLLIAPDVTIASVNPAAEQLTGQGARRLVGRSLASLLSFGEPLIMQRIGEGDAQLFARAAKVSINGQPMRQFDVMTAPVLHFPGWQMLVLNEPLGVEALTGDGAGAGGGGDHVVRAPEILAHEIKNPLAGIRGAAQLLERTVPAKDRALTDLITSEVDRIAKLIDQMQTLSRRSTDPMRPCNLHEALRRAQAVISAASAHAVSIEEEFDPSLPQVMCNPDSLVQVLLNLLANAREASAPVKEPRVRVRTRFASGIALHRGPGNSPLRLPIEVRVSDNGPGIDPALSDHIFEPFVTSKKQGQGLGLALVQKLVREMDGRITHDREEPAGWTHFRIHLPVAKGHGLNAERG